MTFLSGVGWDRRAVSRPANCRGFEGGADRRIGRCFRTGTRRSLPSSFLSSFLAMFPHLTVTNHEEHLMTQRLLAITAALALVLCAPSTEAALVTVNFSGTITSIDDPNGYISGSSVGDPFSGTLVYSTGLAAGVPGANPSIYTYLPSTTPVFATPLGITVTVGSHTFSSSYTGLMQITVQNNLAGAYPDVFGAVADVNVGNTYTLAGFALGDSTGTALSSTDLPTSLDLSKFTVGDFNLVTPNGCRHEYLRGRD